MHLRQSRCFVQDATVVRGVQGGEGVLGGGGTQVRAQRAQDRPDFVSRKARALVLVTSNFALIEFSISSCRDEGQAEKEGLSDVSSLSEEEEEEEVVEIAEEEQGKSKKE